MHLVRLRTSAKARATNRRHFCPGKLPLGFGRLAAPYRIEKPGQLPPTRCATNAKKEMSAQPSGSIRGGAHQEAESLTTGPSSERPFRLESGAQKVRNGLIRRGPSSRRRCVQPPRPKG